MHKLHKGLSFLVLLNQFALLETRWRQTDGPKMYNYRAAITAIN